MSARASSDVPAGPVPDRPSDHASAETQGAGLEDPGGRPLPSLEIADEQDVPVEPERLTRAAMRALEALGAPPGAHLGVTLVGRERIAELKFEAMGVRAATDVLAFPMDDPADPSPGQTVLGDVVLCPDVAREQARALGLDFDDEMIHLLVHGILHVLGWDHAEPRDELAMAAEERRVIDAIGASAP